MEKGGCFVIFVMDKKPMLKLKTSGFTDDAPPAELLDMSSVQSAKSSNVLPFPITVMVRIYAFEPSIPIRNVDRRGAKNISASLLGVQSDCLEGATFRFLSFSFDVIYSQNIFFERPQCDVHIKRDAGG
uniref:Uncharacterized protein LOC107429936 n=1 Tax=Rhizophora mucronata TaxID=61149 RepID=A0A2P2IP12_RHIMU